MPDGVAVEIQRGTWTELPIFSMMQRLGNVETQEMFRTFNMGIGMVVVCSRDNAAEIIKSIDGATEIGEVCEGNGEVTII